MSLGYASRLSWKEDYGGQLGTRELHDKGDVVEKKVERLAEWFSSASGIIVFTGAGISTSCGIPDFRGPKGVWTLQKQGKPPPELKMSFEMSKPSYTHQAIATLVSRGKISYVVSQNVDGLHLRTGIPRDKIAELHGNCFAERCSKCKKEYIRDFEMKTVGFKPTGRKCSAPQCSGGLRDHILDWDDALPEAELQKSEEHAQKADLAVCLGTSLQIIPACDIPLETVNEGGRLAIVNLQKTPKDGDADLVIHSRVDEVMRSLMGRLKIKVPNFLRRDWFVFLHRQSLPKETSARRQTCTFEFEVVSPHGVHHCTMPMLESVTIEFPDEPGVEPHFMSEPPFRWKCVGKMEKMNLRVVLGFGEGADEDKRSGVVYYVIDPLERADYLERKEFANVEKSRGVMVIKEETHSFITQEVRYELDEGQESPDLSPQKRKKRKL
ncbi:hypothetical protein BSKO_03333 [Bryopsis sp. KO-2023]|nr:hypothetical protein BSKO_03333 [Bryopsis sp. KO-2023]